MAKVTITTTSGETIKVDATSEEAREFYDNLPFTSGSVLATQIED